MNKECINKECCSSKECNKNSDLILSVALEQTALSNILNAEGEKIQKALELNCTIEELLAINSSVANTIEDITHLEIVLYNKLKLYLQNCHCDCCQCNDDEQLDEYSCICKSDLGSSITICTTDCKSSTPIDDIEVELYDKFKCIIARGITKQGKLIKLDLCVGEYFIVAINPVSGERQTALVKITDNCKNIVKTFCFYRKTKKEQSSTCQTSKNEE